MYFYPNYFGRCPSCGHCRQCGGGTFQPYLGQPYYSNIQAGTAGLGGNAQTTGQFQQASQNYACMSSASAGNP